MKPFLVASALLLFANGAVSAAQSSNSGGQTDAAKPAAQSSANAPAAPSDSDKNPAAKTPKKPKKVWTNDEISSVGGDGSISVVGNTAVAKPSSRDSDKNSANQASPQERKIAAYRDRLHQLNNQLEATDKKISELRNFKAENTGASGGINMNHGYSMTPVEDQVKTLEVKKKQIQDQIDALEDEARKDGVEPGQLR
jgi:chaperonin cofactor prefoldin